MILLGTLFSLGYGPLGFVKIIGMQFLDFFDFLTNSVMMPIAALATCLLIVRVVGFEKMDKEIELSSAFKRKKLYHFFLKYLADLCDMIDCVEFTTTDRNRTFDHLFISFKFLDDLIFKVDDLQSTTF